MPGPHPFGILPASSSLSSTHAPTEPMDISPNAHGEPLGITAYESSASGSSPDGGSERRNVAPGAAISIPLQPLPIHRASAGSNSDKGEGKPSQQGHEQGQGQDQGHGHGQGQGQRTGGKRHGHGHPGTGHSSSSSSSSDEGPGGDLFAWKPQTVKRKKKGKNKSTKGKGSCSSSSTDTEMERILPSQAVPSAGAGTKQKGGTAKKGKAGSSSSSSSEGGGKAGRPVPARLQTLHGPSLYGSKGQHPQAPAEPAEGAKGDRVPHSTSSRSDDEAHDGVPGISSYGDTGLHQMQNLPTALKRGSPPGKKHSDYDSDKTGVTVVHFEPTYTGILPASSGSESGDPQPPSEHVSINIADLADDNMVYSPSRGRDNSTPKQLISVTTFADVNSSSDTGSEMHLRPSQSSTLPPRVSDASNSSAHATSAPRKSPSPARYDTSVASHVNVRDRNSRKFLEEEVAAVLSGTVKSLNLSSRSTSSSASTKSSKRHSLPISEGGSAGNPPSQTLNAIDELGFGSHKEDTEGKEDTMPPINLTWKGIWKRPASFAIPQPSDDNLKKAQTAPKARNSAPAPEIPHDAPSMVSDPSPRPGIMDISNLNVCDLAKNVSGTRSSGSGWESSSSSAEKKYDKTVPAKRPKFMKKKNKDLYLLVKAVQALQKAIVKPTLREDESRGLPRNDTRIDLEALRRQQDEDADAPINRLLKYIEEHFEPTEAEKIEVVIREVFNHYDTDFPVLFTKLSKAIEGDPNASATHMQGLSTMLKYMNGLDYQNKNKRAGELFLHLASMLAKHPRSLPVGFVLENICFDQYHMKNLAKICRYPLHLLMIIMKYGGERDGHNASVLLAKTVSYINQACHDAANNYEKCRREDENPEGDRSRYTGAWVFGEGSTSTFLGDGLTPRTIAGGVPDDTAVEHLQMFMTSIIVEQNANKHVTFADELEHATPKDQQRKRSKSTVFGIAASALQQLQIANFWSSRVKNKTITTSLTSPTEDSRAPPIEICCKCGAEQRGGECIENAVFSRSPHKFEPLVRCTPLEFAVRLRLPQVVKAILGIDKRWKGVVSRENDWAVGITRDGDDFSCERFVDVWGASGSNDLAFLDQSTANHTLEVSGRMPVLHFVLRSMKCLHEPLLQQFVKQDRPLDVKPGARIWPASYSPGSGKDLDEGSFSLTPEDEAGLEIVRYLLRSCEFDRRMETRDSTYSEIIVKESDQAFTSSHRGVRIQPRKYRKITPLYDRCALFERSFHMMGLALLMQKAPTEALYVFEALIEFAPYSLMELNTRVADHHHSTPSLLLQYRHLWRCTRMGVEILAYDTELTLLHWLCLFGDRNMLLAFLRTVESADKGLLMSYMLARTSKLGWTPAHYAVYSDSWECLALLLETARRLFGTAIQVLVADAPAYIGHTIEGSARQMAAVSIGKETLTDEHVLNIANNLLHDPTTDPSLKSHSPKGFALYGSTNSTGTTPLHLATLFCHHTCLVNLLESGADPVVKTPLEEMDPHDTAIALYNRMRLQDELKRRGGLGLTDPKEREDTEATLAATINRLHQEMGVQKKLRGMATKYALLQILPHLVFVILLGVFATSLRGTDDFLSVDSISAGIPQQGYVQNGTLQTFTDIAEFDDLHAWLQGPLLDNLFPGAATGLFLGYWELVGSIRMSQVRGPQGGCQLPNWWFEGNTNTTVRDAYKQKCYADSGTMRETGIASDVTYFSRRTGREWYLMPDMAPKNYTVDIPNNGTEATRIITSLQTDNIIDTFTRAFFMWFVFYNPSINTFAAVTTFIEIPLSGPLYPYWTASIVPSRAFSLSGGEVFFYFTFVIYLLIYTVYYTVEELADLYATYLLFRKEREGRKRQRGEAKVKYVPPPKPTRSNPNKSANPLAEDVSEMSHPLLPGGVPDGPSPPGSPMGSISGAKSKAASNAKVKKRRISQREKELAVRSRATIERQHTPVVLAQLYGLIKVFSRYFTEDWNFLDIVCLVTIYVGIVTHITLLSKRGSMLHEVNAFPPYDANGVETTHFYTTITHVKDWAVRQNAVVAIALIVHTVKLLKYVTLVPVVGPIVSAIVSTCTSLNVAVFLFVWQFLTVAFAFGMNIIFGEYVDGYKTMYDTFYTVQRHVLSDFSDFEQYYSPHTRLGPFMWLAMTYFCNLLLLNLFIAVITVDYQKNLATATDDWAWTLLETYKVRGLNLVDLSGSLGGAGMWYHLGKMIKLPVLMKRGYPFNKLVMEKVRLDLENAKQPSEQDQEYLSKYRHLNDWHVVWPRIVEEHKSGMPEEHGGNMSTGMMVNPPEVPFESPHKQYRQQEPAPEPDIHTSFVSTNRKAAAAVSQPSSRDSSVSRV
eukprot:TRINITY_DN1710_c1_g2_i1.p1 TRINITY_DN1710_c1_g2~~TRINITY_DN1710_c1_g2_i1.p1  ORF type:complete len:2373 (+),score=639.48 TRINITY_DN1710_c1_g2_i1:147-7121(+)